MADAAENTKHISLAEACAWWLQGAGSSDFVDALTVAVDRLHRTVHDRPDLGKANVTKRVVLVSNFLDAAKEDPDDQFGAVLVDRMQDKGVRMEVGPWQHVTSPMSIPVKQAVLKLKWPGLAAAEAGGSARLSADAGYTGCPCHGLTRPACLLLQMCKLRQLQPATSSS